MILSYEDYLPAFMEESALKSIFMAAAEDIKAEAQAHDNARVACQGQGKALRPIDLLNESADMALYISDEVSLNLMNRLYDDKRKPSYEIVLAFYESADVVQALNDEAAAPTEDYEERIVNKKRLMPWEVSGNALIRREAALYKALCLRLAEAMPK